MPAPREPVPEGYATQADYARMRGYSASEVSTKLTHRGGVIPVYGPRKLVKVAEADALWTINHRPGDAPRAPRDPSKSVPLVAPRRQGKSEPTTQPRPLSGQSGPDSFAPPAATGDDRIILDLATKAKLQHAIVKAQDAQMKLAERKGQLIDKAKAVRKIFAFTRRIRDAWINWPSRVSEGLAAELGVDPFELSQALDRHVRLHLNDLANQQPPDLD